MISADADLCYDAMHHDHPRVRSPHRVFTRVVVQVTLLFWGVQTNKRQARARRKKALVIIMESGQIRIPTRR